MADAAQRGSRAGAAPEQIGTTVGALGRLSVQRLAPEARDRLLTAFRD